MFTKLDEVSAALEEIGIAAYVFDATSDELQSAMRRMDSMLAEWGVKGIRIGYALPSTANGGSLNDVSGLPDWARSAVHLNLAIRIAPSFGKTISPETRISAFSAYQTVLSQAATVTPMQLAPYTPAGAGNKRGYDYQRYFLPKPAEILTAGPDGEIEFNP